MKKEIYYRATDKNQYDFSDIDWIKEGFDSPFRIFFYQFILKYLKNKNYKNCLDIGCGTGYLINKLSLDINSNFIGIDPSKKNINFAKKSFPKFKFIETDLESYNTTEKFDLIISIMAFNHIGNLDSAFKKVCKFLNSGGNLLLIVPNYDYYKEKRHDYNVDVYELNNNEYAVKIKRDFGIIADIVRKVLVYKNFAEKYGLILKKHDKMKPNDYLLSHYPSYSNFTNKSVTDLLFFKKN